MRNFLTTLAVLLLVCGPSLGRAADPAGFDTANQSYAKGDFKTARAGYETLVKSGDWSANLFFNLGNADYRLGDKGAAFVAYERALALDPAHPEARANLSLLREETGARLQAPSWFSQALGWPLEATHNRAEWLAALAFWALCLSLAPRWIKRAPVLWVLAVPSLLVLLWCGAALAWQESRGGTWIITATEATARVAPADGSEKAGTLPMGSHAQLLLERGEWLYLLLPTENADGSQARGWLSRTAAEPIALPSSS